MTRYYVGPAAVASLPRLEVASTMFVIRGRGRVKKEDNDSTVDSLAAGHAYFLAAGAGAELSSDQGGLEVYWITVGSNIKVYR